MLISNGWGHADVRVLVTGADGFAGLVTLPVLMAAGHDVTGAVREKSETVLPDGVRRRTLELDDPESVRSLLDEPCDVVLHLAAVASSRAARDDPGHAWNINAAGTVRLVDAMLTASARSGQLPKLVLVSSGEVYGAGSGEPRARLERDLVAPQSTYAASKVAAEEGAREAWRRAGLPVIVARSFQHTGPSQAPTYVIPALASRLVHAKRSGQRTIAVGNLAPVRDILDVRDVAQAYLALIERGRPGEIYNVSRGQGISLSAVLARLTELVGVEIVPETSPELARRADVPHLVGDSAKLRAETGWAPTRTLDDSLRDVVDAQTH